MLAILMFSFLSTFASAETLTVIPPNKPAYFTEQFFGVHSHNPDKPGHYPGTPFGAWRMWDGHAGTWADVQPKDADTWSWTTTDAYLAQVEKTPGTKVLITFGRMPRWAAADDKWAPYGYGSASPPADMNQYRTFVRAIVTRYKGRIEAYQTGNESNTSDFWTGTTKELVDLTCAAYEEIKAIDPTIQVVSPSGTGAYSPNTDFVKNFLDLGGAQCIDVIAYHLYTSGGPPENFVRPLLKVREALDKAGYGNFPLWNTETGYLTPGTALGAYSGWDEYSQKSRVSDYDASDFVTRSFFLARAIGFERFYTYAWDNDKLGHVDLLSGGPRETANVITRFYKKFTNGGTIGTCALSGSGVWTCAVKFSGANRDGQVVWVDPNVKSQIQLYSVPLRCSVSNFHNDDVTNVPGKQMIAISATPKLLVWN